MDATKGHDSALAAEISQLLSLTRTFSNSFGIRGERVRNWRLTGIVTELEKDGVINLRLFRKAITHLIPDGLSRDSLHQWQYKYVDEYKNPDGALLEERYKKPQRSRKPTAEKVAKRARKPNLDVYALSPLFRICEAAYVSEFLGLRANEIGPIGIDVDGGTAHRVFKALLTFQKTHYLPLWLQLVKDLEKICGEKKYSTLELSDWSMRDPFWVILLLAWQSELSHPEKWLLEGDINKHAVRILVFPTGAGVAECLHAISRDKGCRILRRRKGDFDWEFLLNGEYESALRNYSTKLSALREKLMVEVRTALSASRE